MPEDVLRNREPALELVSARRIELDLCEHVISLNVLADLVRQLAAPPWLDLDDLAASARDRSGHALDRGWDILFGDVLIDQDDHLVFVQLLLR